MKYRIVEDTNYLGDPYYFIQKRIFIFFWKTVSGSIKDYNIALQRLKNKTKTSKKYYYPVIGD